MIISHKHRFIFVKTVKTAGTSIEVFLSQHLAESDILTPIYPPVAPHKPRNYKGFWNPIREYYLAGKRNGGRILKEFIQRKKFYNHIPAAIIRARIPEDIWENYYKFCVERNPWDKTFSHYAMRKYRSGGTLTVEEYFEQGIFCYNFPRYLDRDGNMLVDRVIKYERLTEELGEVFESVGIPFEGSLGVMAKSSYKEKSGVEVNAFAKHQDRISEIFEKEINYNGYQLP